MDSLRVHASQYFRPSKNAMEPDLATKFWILDQCERAYQGCVTVLDDDFDSYEAYKRALRRLDMSSSPGFPYTREATTNGSWLGWDGIQSDPIKVERLWFDVRLVMDDKWENILKVFIKQEPHSINKSSQKRWRLIMAASLPVQVVWHMLFAKQNDKEIERAYFIPSQHGFVAVGGGWKQFLRAWNEAGYTRGVDKSAWDWTAPSWALSLDLEFRKRMIRGDRIGKWYELARSMYRHMFEEAILMTSDGKLWRQVVPGIMKSGCVNTISTNGHCQVFIHMAVCRKLGRGVHPIPRTCGDDTIHSERDLDTMLSYADYGILIKGVSKRLEFVGHDFSWEGPKPLYMKKHLFKLKYAKKEVLPDLLDSMARMYVHTRYFEFWDKLARLLGCPLPYSKAFYLSWYDYSP